MFLKMFRRLLLIPVLVLTLQACKKSNNSSQPVQNDIATVDTKVDAFMSKYSVPGASLAITKNGKLVYRKGYGLADKAANEKVTVDHRFRIASVSKIYTAAAILKLVQEGKLTLNSKVFGPGGILGTEYGTQPYKQYVTDITVKHLLQHTAGGWSNQYPGDPVFENLSYNNKQIFDWTLNNKPLTQAPGTKYEYSNFGFFVLGRVIEKVTGKSYIDYLRQDILNGLGVKATELAGSTEAERKPKEVKYYGTTDAQFVYAYNLPRMDANGGLISTPTEMLRFFTAVDGFPTRPDILNSSSITAFTTASGPAPLNPYYALGITVEPGYWYHFGSLPGMYSVMIRNDKGVSAAFVINTRYPGNTAFVNDFTNLVVGIIDDAGISWQDIDQF